MNRRHEELIEADNSLFKNRKRFPKFVSAPLRGFLYSKLDRLSLQQLECEMDSTGYPDDHNILIQRNCDHHYTQWNLFHTQAAE